MTGIRVIDEAGNEIPFNLTIDEVIERRPWLTRWDCMRGIWGLQGPLLCVCGKELRRLPCTEEYYCACGYKAKHEDAMFGVMVRRANAKGAEHSRRLEAKIATLVAPTHFDDGKPMVQEEKDRHRVNRIQEMYNEVSEEMRRGTHDISREH